MKNKDKYGLINLGLLQRRIDAAQTQHDFDKKFHQIDPAHWATLNTLKAIKEECELLPSAEEVFDAGAEYAANAHLNHFSMLNNIEFKEMPIVTFDQFIVKYKKP